MTLLSGLSAAVLTGDRYRMLQLKTGFIAGNREWGKNT